jgi:hypothetical protein
LSSASVRSILAIGQIDPADDSRDKIGLVGDAQIIPGFAKIVPGLHENRAGYALAVERGS